MEGADPVAALQVAAQLVRLAGRAEQGGERVVRERHRRRAGLAGQGADAVADLGVPLAGPAAVGERDFGADRAGLGEDEAGQRAAGLLEVGDEAFQVGRRGGARHRAQGRDGGGETGGRGGIRQGDRATVLAGQADTGGDRELADRERPAVQGMDLRRPQPVEETVGEHRGGAGEGLLGRLEDEDDGAGERAPGQDGGDAHADGGVDVVSTQVRGGARAADLVARGHGVHVGAVGHRAARAVAAQDADDAVAADRKSVV